MIAEDGRVSLDQVGTVARGRSRHRPRDDSILYGGKYPFVQTGDVKRATLYLNDYSQTYNEVGLAQSKLWPVGTLCITIAANIAETAILGIPACFPDSVIGFTPDPKKSDLRFVKYCLDCFKLQVQAISQGTTQDNLSLEKLKSLRFLMPPVEVQQKIAAILTAYDDLIENNRQRITLLEKMAEEIYREWFVRLRFPGHEHTPVEKGMPEGADVSTLRDHIAYYIGGGWGAESPKGRENQPVHVIRGTDFDAVASGDVSTVPLRFEKSSSVDSRKLQPGDIIMENSVNHASRTSGKSILITAGILNLFDGDVICASFCKLLRPKRYEYAKLLHLNFKLIFEQGLFEIYQNVATNGIANLQVERFLDKHLILIPPNIDVRKLNCLDVSPIAQMQAHLKATRDLLLNRLISGKLRVDDLDIQFPPSMQKDAA